MLDGREYGRKPLKRRKPRNAKHPLIAFDLETTPIMGDQTPQPLYVTAHSPDLTLSLRLSGLDDLKDVLVSRFLTPDLDRARYVSWNGNRFDNLLVGLSLMDSDFEIRPYLTRSGSVRGFRITDGESTWEFLDGMAMTGLKCSLDKFLKTFAPEYPKLGDHGKHFDSTDPEHIAYAERDSEGLYHAIIRADKILRDFSGIGLQPTIGNAAVKVLKANLPEHVKIWPVPPACNDAIRSSALRGGFCWADRQYQGPLYKYDLNQAYAAAMRDTRLPHGRCMHTHGYEGKLPAIYKVVFWRDEPSSVPFYYRRATDDNDQGLGLFSTGSEDVAWITNGELEQLRSEGWSIQIIEGYVWMESFCLSAWVERLEVLRLSDPEGPSGPLGTMVKAIGNNAYGKTLEQHEGIELCISSECPDGWSLYRPELPEFDQVYFRFSDADKIEKDYHRPQIGLFVTAHVRMEVRRAAMQGDFIYADTDCVAFSEPINSEAIEIHKSRYGAWKQETSGEPYLVLGKKTYASLDGEIIRCKGLEVKRLDLDQYKQWIEGEPPIQKQVQRQSFMKLVSGSPMFRNLDRRGTDFTNLPTVELRGERFIPRSYQHMQSEKESAQLKRYERALIRSVKAREARELRQVILDYGGIRRHSDGALSGEYAELPRSIRRVKGLPADVMADVLRENHPELGIEDESSLYSVLRC